MTSVSWHPKGGSPLALGEGDSFLRGSFPTSPLCARGREGRKAHPIPSPCLHPRFPHARA